LDIINNNVEYIKPVTALLTAKGHTAVANYQIRLRILTACQVFLISYNGWEMSLPEGST